jgi:hypothetical protein
MSVTIIPAQPIRAPDQPLRLVFFISADDLRFYEPSISVAGPFRVERIMSQLWDIEIKLIDQVGRAVFGHAFSRNNDSQSPFRVMSNIRDNSWFGVNVTYNNNITAEQLYPDILHLVVSKGSADSELIFTIKPLSPRREAEINQREAETTKNFARRKELNSWMTRM